MPGLLVSDPDSQIPLILPAKPAGIFLAFDYYDYYLNEFSRRIHFCGLTLVWSCFGVGLALVY